MNLESGIFHPGELALQERAGVRDRIGETAPRFVRSFMPDQHRELFARLPTLFVGSVDAQRRPWASILFGAPGFITTPDARHLSIDAWPVPGDPLRENLALAAPLGMLGIEPQTRRRNRVNATVVEVSGARFTVEVDQSFGNCPQYIQARTPRWVDAARPIQPVVARDGLLDRRAAALVERADTFYIATAAARASGHAGAQGVDVSHRGGRPGFVRVTQEAGATVLLAPDFRGNFLFNTLGNIVANPRAGLLFIDYDRGDLLQVMGTAAIIWDGPEVEALTGAQRLLRVTVTRSRWFEGALPLRWSAPQPAAQLAATGIWQR
ncbi:MAG TPA: pyridoxamine 5'-phosphate oxidase family protein [Burkholderiaceae bacterium]|nr:pyridoxamine 5'-phosphate oxidase family protein [Burkholderiaceae bacterium]